MRSSFSTIPILRWSRGGPRFRGRHIARNQTPLLMIDRSTLMAFLGPRPSECSAGETTRLDGIIKVGNARARKALADAAWTLRHAADTGVQDQQA